MPALAMPWPRAQRRAVSRREARRFAFYNGPAPRYEPAAAPVCATHHRRLPCARCPKADS
jgi:hypothetical protein